MKKLLLQNANAVLPDGKVKAVSILIEDGKIADISFENKFTNLF